MKRILLSEQLSEAGVAILEEAGFQVDQRVGLTAEELEAVIGDYEALIVRSATRVNERLLERGEKLSVVGRAGMGVDNIDVPACSRRGIVVVNTPSANSNAVAELTVALALALYRNLAQACRMVQQGDFRRGLLRGEEILGKSVGIIGLGNIGSRVAENFRALGMHVLAYDRYAPPERFERLRVQRCETLEELLRASDLISIHTPKTKESLGLIGEEELRLCRPGVRIINAARGGLVDEKALYNALESGQVASAALDVLETEPDYQAPAGGQTKTLSRLIGHPHCLYVPHLGASTREASEAVSRSVCESVVKLLRGEIVPAVNLPRISGSLEEMGPWLRLAEKLARIYYQSETEALREVELIYRGKRFESQAKLLLLSVAQGLLHGLGEEAVNLVNVGERVKELGLALHEREEASTQTDQTDTAGGDTLRLRFVRQGKSLELAGTVLLDGRPFLLDFYGYRLTAPITANMVAIQNADVPGIVGRVGTILGEGGLNISAVHWASKEGQGRAESLISLDAPVSDSVLETLRAIRGVLRVTRLAFPD